LSHIARRIRVTGVVQGVGFRPFVWHLARELALTGWVRNDAAGVDIEVTGDANQIAELQRRLRTDAPPLARVEAVTSVATTPSAATDFVIIDSAGGKASTAIGPDVGLCPDCLAELFDPESRRWRHGFITCTHCGPRYTITRTLPYDRSQTALAGFPLCPPCAAEYGNPADRRFHAETTCCPDCGPSLALIDAQGQPIAGDPIASTLQLLRDGAIVGIKGLGGFHLACDARNADTVRRLRERKNREAKPFAIMFAILASVGEVAQVTADDARWLDSRERPIVLLRAQPDCDSIFPGIAPGLLWLGAMLPVTPIQWLLFHEAAGRPSGTDWLADPQALALVMTSANPGGEPIVRDNDEALARLNGIADAILQHNRDVVARCDDSVLRPVGSAANFIRRGRGYAPTAIRLPRSGPSVLAFGAFLKNTVCVTRGDETFLSPHIGDLDTAATCNFLDETVARMLDLLEVKPQIIAHDLHPDYFSTRAATQFAAQRGLPLLGVQHHHAHIAAVCAEHGWQEPIIGLALDGVGLGTEGGAWGGELLRVDGAQFTRIGHLRPLPLPGGDRAAHEPWRMAAAVLHASGRSASIAQRFSDPAAATVTTMLQRQINCPATSSLGRIFDAAAALLGIRTHCDYEAHAAIQLEQAATRYIDQHGWPQPMTDAWGMRTDGTLDLLPMLANLEPATNADAAAARFHASLVTALSDWAASAANTSGLATVAIGGGCLLNRLLSTGLRQNLEQRGLRVLTPRQAPPGDGGLALGQAWVAINAMEQ
jgi:hydrogenase maturation protein HypF